LRAMHHWDGQACRIRAASEKAQYCQAASAQGQVQWIAESVECRCTSNTTFIFNGQQCVPPNQMQQGFGGQQQYYDPASGCGLSGGQWMQNNMCQCPMGPNGVAIQWDQMTNSCRSSSFQGGCPYWNGQQCLAAPGGAVLIYNMIFGWVTKSLLDSLF
jgi:hypothetical protein